MAKMIALLQPSGSVLPYKRDGGWSTEILKSYKLPGCRIHDGNGSSLSPLLRSTMYQEKHSYRHFQAYFISDKSADV